MKIKMPVEYDPQSLKKSVNEFIADRHMVNTQFKINNYPDCSALATYEDSDNWKLTL